METRYLGHKQKVVLKTAAAHPSGTPAVLLEFGGEVRGAQPQARFLFGASGLLKTERHQHPLSLDTTRKGAGRELEKSHVLAPSLSSLTGHLMLPRLGELCASDQGSEEVAVPGEVGVGRVWILRASGTCDTISGARIGPEIVARSPRVPTAAVPRFLCACHVLTLG